jgi:hypothetical protein
MNKKIFLAITTSDNAIAMDGFQTININQLQEIFACSVDVIYCGSFSILPNDTAYNVLSNVLEKIKPNGQLVLNILDTKRICQAYINGNMEEKVFFDYMKQIHNSINYMDIMSYCQSNQKAKVVDLKKNTLVSSITIVKTGV